MFKQKIKNLVFGENIFKNNSKNCGLKAVVPFTFTCFLFKKNLQHLQLAAAK